MNPKQQKYLESKLRSAVTQVEREFVATHPVSHTQEVVAAKLRTDGYTVPHDHYLYITLPPTDEMTANAAKLAKFQSAAREELGKCIDTIYLGEDKDALAVLTTFSETLKGLIK